MADTITIEFVGDTAKLTRASAAGMKRVAADVRGAEGDVGKSADKMADRFEDAFDGLHARVGRKVGPGFVSLGGQLGGKIAGGFAALGITTLIADQLNKALDIDAGVDKLEARLGLTAVEAEKIGKIAGDTYAAAWGDSMEEVQGFYAETMRAFPKLTDAALQKVTESAATTADVWDQDFNEVVRAAQQLLVNGLAPDAQTAMDQVATALQKTKGPQDEVLQALEEYTNHFAQVGLDGTQILGALTSEWATNQYAIDKVGDAVKELPLKIEGAADDTKTALKDMGLSIGEVESAWAKGGDSAQDMTERIITGILNIKDPVEQHRVGVALMGTSYEDLGKNAPKILRDVLEGQEDLTDSVELGGVAYDNAKTKIEEFRRKGLKKLTEFVAETAIPVIETLVPFLENRVIPVVQTFFDVFTDEEDGAPGVASVVEDVFGTQVPESIGVSADAMDRRARDERRDLRASIQQWKDWNERLGGTLSNAQDATARFGKAFHRSWRGIWDTFYDIESTILRNTIGRFINWTTSESWARGWGRVAGFASTGVGRILGIIQDLIDMWNRVAGAFGGPTIGGGGRPARLASSARSGSERRGGSFAEGGQIPGGLDLASRDDVIARLSRGEWVMPTDAVAKYGPKFMESIQQKLLPTDVLQDYAVGGQVRGLNADFYRRLVAYSEAINTFLYVVSGYRTTAQQAALYAAKPGLAAPPGRSLHEKGIAADLSPQLGGTSRGNPVAGRFGLVYPMSYEPWHVQLASGRGGPGAVFDFAQIIRDAISKIFDSVSGDSLYDRLARAVIRTARDAMLDKVPSFADGTPFVKRDGLARVHRGERIASAGGGDVYVTVNVAGSVRSDRELQQIIRKTIKTVGPLR